ncbi:hypothetical protein BB560_006335, partial [Smittium megazygosporum]
DRHSKFDEMRSKHYFNEGIYVKDKDALFWGMKNGKFVVNKEFDDQNDDSDTSSVESLDNDFLADLDHVEDHLCHDPKNHNNPNHLCHPLPQKHS